MRGWKKGWKKRDFQHWRNLNLCLGTEKLPLVHSQKSMTQLETLLIADADCEVLPLEADSVLLCCDASIWTTKAVLPDTIHYSLSLFHTTHSALSDYVTYETQAGSCTTAIYSS